MEQAEILALMKSVNALITNSHLIYTSGRHGDAYVNKDAVYPHTEITSRLCSVLAKHFEKQNIEVVLAPAIGGVILSQWIAHHLTKTRGRDVLSVYAEKTTEAEGFVIKRGYDKLIADKRTLIVEDILTTGGSVKKVVEVARKCGADIIGVAALCNRGGITAKDLGEVPELYSLVNIELTSWEADQCPLCIKKVPINTDVGKGKELATARRA